ncbi:MAG: hypothetical protein Q7U35_04650 [Methanobacteriaceae archaeon]|nr:hypothetical protein [Methanobacteriaceae archaeon]
MKRNKTIMIIAVLSMIFIITTISSFLLYSNEEIIASSSSDTDNNVSLGATDYGSVEKLGPYGNTSSPVKIAYITGVHPLEYKSHQALMESLINSSSSLKYCYYIYKINVTQDKEDYNKGRMNGQLLANKYVVSDIAKNNFNMAIDVHSNSGNWKENQFIFAPVSGSESESYAKQIKNKLIWLTYYVPPNPTSTDYVTGPLIKAGVPAIIYETYNKESYDVTLEHVREFIGVVEGIF